MASRQFNARKLGWLLACLCIAGAGCDDDTAADEAHEDGEHGDHAHDEAGSGGHDHDSVIGDLTGTVCPEDGGTLTYENFGKKFMQDYCLSCHSVSSTNRNGAPDDHNFDELVDIDGLRAHIDQYAGSGPDATNEVMPKADPKPTLEERKKLSEWLACGPK